MRLKDVLEKSNVNNVRAKILKYYPIEKRNIDKFMDKYYDLKEIDPVELKQESRILIEKISDIDDEDDFYFDVSGLYEKDNFEDLKSIDDVPLQELLSYDIHENDMLVMTEDEIIAHVLYELIYLNKGDI